jgi:hypothetical protein
MRPALLLAAALALAGCALDWSPVVICHNANCAEPANPDDDDTPEALDASLALLGQDGRPAFDGLEIDTFWHGAEGTCLFAHDLNPPVSTVLADAPVRRIAAHLGARAEGGLPLTRTAERFTLLIELKGHSGPKKSEKHTPAERTSHAACAVEIGALLKQLADDGYPLEVVYTSFDPLLLADLKASPGFDALSTERFRVRIGILQGIPKPLDSQTVPLSEFPESLGADLVSVHPHWTTKAERQAFASRGLELGYWMFSLVPETLDAIRTHRPSYVTTGEARAFDAWLRQQ